MTTRVGTFAMYIRRRSSVDSDEEYAGDENRNGMDAATNVNGANGNHEEQLSHVEEFSATTSAYEKIDEMGHNDGKRKLDNFYDNKEEPLDKKGT